MPTSGITKTFIVLGKEQTEKFANAIEDSYQESLHRKESLVLKYIFTWSR